PLNPLSGRDRFVERRPQRWAVLGLGRLPPQQEGGQRRADQTDYVKSCDHRNETKKKGSSGGQSEKHDSENPGKSSTVDAFTLALFLRWPRLPCVYGPGDYQHRTFEYLKRMDDGRP